jgi:sigma-B regulation protein RsbU (phosphoserine phosphatase)
MQDGKFSLLRDKHGLVLGGMEGIIYTDYEIKLAPGDKLFLYTDGIPEASDADYNMFGTDGMLDALNKDVSSSPREILNHVQGAVENFVNGAEQFDDMTMLCLEYKGITDR